MLNLLVAASLVSVAPSLAAPQTDNLIEVLIKPGDPVPGLGPDWFVDQVGSPVAGANGGWATGLRARTAGFSYRNILVGQLPGSLDGPVLMLRGDLPAGVDPLQRLGGPSLGGGLLGYRVAPSSGSTSQDRSVWVGDALVARRDHPVPGRPGATWATLSRLQMGSGGDAVVVGSIFDPSTPQIRNDVLWDWQSEEVLVAEGDAIPGLPAPLGIFPSVAFSPDVQQWASIAFMMGDERRAIVVNGAAHEFAPGSVAMDGELVPSSFTGGVAGLRWDGFDGVEINDRGHVVFTGIAVGGTDPLYITIRNNRTFSIEHWSPVLNGIDERGGVLTGVWVPRYESSRILRATPQVDVDRDGLPDSEYSAPQTSSGSTILTRDRSELLMYRRVIDDAGEWLFSVVRGRRGRIGTSVCNGFLTSAGRPAELVATGSAVAQDNEVTLRVFELPTASRGYALVSRTFGVVQFPSGSQGQLCLQGAIGRLQSELFLAEIDGRAAVTLDTANIPQPVGFASAMAGDTWYAQAWFRDSLQGVPTSNFTSATQIDFLP